MLELKEAIIKLQNEEINKIQIQLPNRTYYVIKRDELFFDKLNIEKYVPSVFDRREIMSCKMFLRFFKFFNNEEYEILEN